MCVSCFFNVYINGNELFIHYMCIFLTMWTHHS